MALGMLQVIITAQGIMLPDIIGVLPGTGTTGVLTGGTGIGGMAGGTGIELGRQPSRKINQIGRYNIPGLIGAQVRGLSRSVFHGSRDKCRPQA